jgi:hypothetical protein
MNVADEFPPPSEKTIEAIREAEWYGKPNRLSHEHISWPVIDEVAAETRKSHNVAPDTATFEVEQLLALSHQIPNVDARQIIQQRRSCLALDGLSTLSRELFLRILARTLPGPGPPWDASYWPPSIHLALFVHRVDGVPPGLYLLVRDSVKQDLLRRAMRETFLWETPEGVSPGFPFFI